MGINFQNVNFKYDSKNKIETLKNINLNINSKGEFITILGHTGSGKSTLVQMMNALIFPTSGELSILNNIIKPKHNKNLKDIRRQVGLVFQFPEYQLFEETVLKDISFGPINFGISKEEAEKVTKETCELLHISEELYQKPPFNLSGGQKRKVAIAGILASKPEILILDEPTVGLDPSSRKELLELLKQIHEETNKTIIIVTHDMNLVANYSKRTIVLDEGQIVFDDDTRKLFNNYKKLQSLNLDLPYISKLALELKERGIIAFDELPITLDELYSVMRGDTNE